MKYLSNQVKGALVATLLIGGYLGCQQRDEQAADIATLPYLTETHHRQLQEELARLRAEKATPVLLDKSRAVDGTTTKERAEQLANKLEQIFPTDERRLVLQRISHFYPSDAFQFDPIALQQARETAEQFAPRLKAYRELFRQDGFRWEISLRDGLLANLSALDHATLAHRLEAIRAADLLASGQPSDAILPLRNMLRTDRQLATIPSVSARLTAARLRAEASFVIAAIVTHPRCSRASRAELLSIIEDELTHWTPDRVAWIGDRALGIHAYELVRDGQLMSILTAEEITQLKRDGQLDAFAKAVRQSVDEDQWFYLSAMRRVIDACDKPFFARIKVLDQIDQELNASRNTSHYPLFAAKVLLPNLKAGHRTQALDRARCEAWAIALRAAVGKPYDWPELNPVTGEPYQVDHDANTLVIRHLAGKQDTAPDIMVPLPRR